MELAAEDAAVAGGGADLAPAVDGVGQAVLIADGLGLVAVDKIALLTGLERGQRRAGKIRAPAAGVERIPTDVRHLLRMAVHVRVGDLYHTARNKPKALVQTELLRLVKQHLHS